MDISPDTCKITMGVEVWIEIRVHAFGRGPQSFEAINSGGGDRSSRQ